MPQISYSDSARSFSSECVRYNYCFYRKRNDKEAEEPKVSPHNSTEETIIENDSECERDGISSGKNSSGMYTHNNDIFVFALISTSYLTDHLALIPTPYLTDHLTLIPTSYLTDHLTLIPTSYLTDHLTLIPTPYLTDHLTLIPTSYLTDHFTLIPTSYLTDHLTLIPTSYLTDHLTPLIPEYPPTYKFLLIYHLRFSVPL